MRRMAAETSGQFLQVMGYAYGRDPVVFEHSRRSFEEMSGKTYNDEAKQHIRKVLLNPSDYILSMPKEYGFKAFLPLDELTDVFLNTYWSLVVPQRGFFITGDNPLIRLVPREAAHPAFGDFGFKNKRMEVTFPLSPRLLLVLTYFKPPNDRSIVNKEAVVAQNAARAWHCEYEIYSHLKHKRIWALCREYADQRPGIRLRGAAPEKFALVKIQRRRRRK